MTLGYFWNEDKTKAFKSELQSIDTGLIAPYYCGHYYENYSSVDPNNNVTNIKNNYAPINIDNRD